RGFVGRVGQHDRRDHGVPQLLGRRSRRDEDVRLRHHPGHAGRRQDGRERDPPGDRQPGRPARLRHRIRRLSPSMALRYRALTLIAGVAAATGAVAAPAATAATPRAAALSSYFNNVGITDDANPTAGNIDGEGASLSAQDLAAAGWAPGTRVTVNG